MATKKTASISSSPVRFGDGVGAVRALPKARGKRPAVILLHERYGIDQHTKDLTTRLAQAGFVGLAPDLFHRYQGDRKPVLRGEQRGDLRYGIDQHTKDLTTRLAQAGFVGLAPDLFHRYQGDRKPVLRGEQRVDLRD